MSKVQKTLIGFVVGCILGFGFLSWFNKGTEAMPKGPEFMVRWDAMSFDAAVQELEAKGVVRDAWLFTRLAKLEKKSVKVGAGTYSFYPGMSMEQVIDALKTPLSQNVRIPEGWWIGRVAERLEAKGVCKATEYIDLAHNPLEFKEVVKFDLPAESLEGYLFPDTYDMPPMLGAKAVIAMQLRTFEKKVVDKLGTDGLSRALIVGSMVELEAAKDEERPRVAGVIENRIKKGMRLQIDATVLYAMGKWQELGPGVVNTVKSPYNTYLNNGLPPGPIGSPGFKSIEAATKPESHNFLFYVARPNRSHYFTPDYNAHRAAITKARAEWKAERESGE